MTGKIRKYVIIAFRSSVVIYTLIALYYFLSKASGSGDESVFISDLQFIENEGWIAAIRKGISIPYMLLGYVLSKILPAVVALRGVNVLLFLLLLAYFRFLKKIKPPDFYFLILFFYSSIGYFLAGSNDTLFIISMVVFFTETHYLLSSSDKPNASLWAVGLIVAFFTREMFVVFVPVVALSIFYLLKRNKITLKSMIAPLFIGVFFLVLNYPSITTNHKLSYDLKLPPSGVTVNWPQRQYLAQLMVNEGKLSNYNHPTWKVTQEYVNKNGERSLPHSVFTGITFNLTLTIKEFFKDLGYIMLYSVRSMGLLVIIVLFFGFKLAFKERQFTQYGFIPVSLLIVVFVFSFIIISFVELRWMSSIFMAAIVYYCFMIERNIVPNTWVILNYSLLALLSFYGSYGLLLKIL
jgi:hypothetical protein